MCLQLKILILRELLEKRKDANFGGDNWSAKGWEEMQFPALSRNKYAGKLQGTLESVIK